MLYWVGYWVGYKCRHIDLPKQTTAGVVYAQLWSVLVDLLMPVLLDAQC